MGAGKTTAGYKLAKLLGYRFVDLDSRIEEVETMPVSAIFLLKGEDYFRRTETSVLHSLANEERMVVATGGGLPCFNENMNWMKVHGITVYLKMTAEALFHRLRTGRTKRPLIEEKSDTELLEYIQNTLHFREHFYGQADVICNGKDLDIGALARTVIDREKA